MRNRSLILLVISFLIAAFARAQYSAPELMGKIQEDRYISPTGQFSMPIPVLEELGGQVTDSSNVVTFEDAFTTHITIAVYPMDNALRQQLATKTKKDFLADFFSQAILPSLLSQSRGSSVESAKFLPKTMDGALLLQTLMPGGTMFLHRIFLFGRHDNIPVAKRGNLLFVRGDSVFIISSELVERSTERSLYTKTTAEEDEILRERLLKILDRMTFTTATNPSANITAPAK
ncbi:MAG: hypothetical protein WC378_19660 [Opitutaceae bacterium]|jgi:hypothetical protein